MPSASNGEREAVTSCVANHCTEGLEHPARGGHLLGGKRDHEEPKTRDLQDRTRVARH